MKKLSYLSLILMMLLISVSANAALAVKGSGGWNESAWLEFTGLSDSYAKYNAYITQDGKKIMLDGELIRSYGTYGRVDALGLAAGTYAMTVVPVGSDGKEISADAAFVNDIVVVSNDRAGFAHAKSSGWTEGVGAYNNDGTLKTGAKVLYVTKETAKTVTMDVQTDSKGTKTKYTGLQAIVTGYQKGYETTPLDVRFIGLITADDMDGFDSSAEGLQIKGKKADSPMNMTFEGVGNDAMVRGFGFLIRNSKSVEFRNFAIKTEMDDDLSFDTDNSNCWVHNMDIFYGAHGSGDHAKGDGAIDIKSDSKFVTVSYCRFWDTGKSSMCGMKSESGPNYITYHHNWFDHSDSRHARVRTMSVHMYNNYFCHVSKYGVGATCGSSVFMENNYFLKTSHPMLISMQGTDAEGDGTFSGEDGGIIKAFGNKYENCPKAVKDYSENNTSFDCYTTATRDAKIPSTVVTKQGGTCYDNFDTNSDIMYEYTPDETDDVPGIVTGDHGAGRLQHGDFTWEWNATDEGYAYDADLAAALKSYQTSFVKIIGTESAGGGDTPTPDPGKTASTFALTSGTTVSLVAPATSQITYTGNAGTVTYNSGDESVATVSDGGLITAVGNGSTNIYVSDPGSETVSGATVTIKVTVSKEATGTEVVYFLSEDGTLTSSNESLVQVITANAKSKTTGTYNGVTYNTILKMESATEIDITPSKDCKAKLVFDTASKNFKISENESTTQTKYATGSDKTYTLDLKGGTKYVLKKGDSMNIICIDFDFGEAEEIIPTVTLNAAAESVTGNSPAYNLAGQRVAAHAKGIVIKNGRKFVNR